MKPLEGKFLPISSEPVGRKQTVDEKVIFALGDQVDGSTLVVLGVPRAAFKYMRHGDTHTFDLTKAGLPIKIVMFGGRDHAHVMSMMNQAADMSAAKVDLDKDYSIDGSE